MIQHIDEFYIAAQVRLVRQMHRGCILLVEGSTDARVLERFVDAKTCEIEVGFGKDNVIGAVDLLEEEGFEGIVALVDADFDRLLGRSYNLENLIMTDCHDLDLVIFESGALDVYVREFGDNERFEKNFSLDVDEVRKRVMNAALPIAICRYVSDKRQLDLYFKDLDYQDFVKEDDLSIDKDGIIDIVFSRSKASCNIIDLRRYVLAERSENHELRQLLCGHDVSAILGIALRDMLGKRRVPQTWGSEIEAGLRLAFDQQAFSKTGLWKDFCEWQELNPPYVVLRRGDT